MTDTPLLRVFLCHASSDKPAVRKLYEKLVENRIDAWLDKEKLIPGQNWQIEIQKAVHNSDVVIVCLSSQSVNKEGFVQKEIKFALDKADEKPEGTIFIIPARLEECDVPERISKFQWVDLFLSDGYEWLIKALQIRAENIGAIIEPKKNMIVSQKEPSAPTIQGYATIHNFLALPTNVLVNGRNICTIDVDGEKDIPLFSIPATVEYEVIRQSTGDRKWGVKVWGKWENSVHNKAVLETTNVIGNCHYFYPVLTNNTNLAWEVVINEGLTTERSAGILSPYTKNVTCGYYEWYTNSNVSLHSGNMHRSWGVVRGQGQAIAHIASRSGRLLLTLESHHI